MSLGPTSLAAAVGSSVKNVSFQPSAEVVPRKVLIIATYDPLKTSVVDEVPVQVLSPEDAGDKFGLGFMAHRLAVRAFEGSEGVPTYIQPQAEAGGAVVATGTITFSTTGTKAEIMGMYIAGIRVPVALAEADSADDIATKAVAVITANDNLPITAVVNGITANQIDITAKTKGPWGNDIVLSFNEQPGEEFPVGVSVVVVDMASGTGIPTISDALNALGTGDNANEDFYTDVVHGYGQDTTSIDAIANYVGLGNVTTGLYSKTVGRPFRCLTGDTAVGSAGLTALQVITDARLFDRANGIVAIPGSPAHPSEIAAQTIGHMARINNIRPEQNYLSVFLNGILPGKIIPGSESDRWTSDYDNRDIAVKAGISPTLVKSGVVYLQNVVSFYRPAGVPVNSNGYRSMRNISILQNVIQNVRTNFEAERWQGISIVADVTAVSSAVNKEKARDIDAVKGDLLALARAFEKKAWIYEAEFTIANMGVTIRSGTDGFNTDFPILLSGEGNIFDTQIRFDTSIAILTA